MSINQRATLGMKNFIDEEVNKQADYKTIELGKLGSWQRS